MQEAIITAVSNKRAGGMGLTLGGKAFRRTFSEGAEMLKNIQDVYLETAITVAKSPKIL